MTDDVTLLVRIGQHFTIPKYHPTIPISFVEEDEGEEDEKAEENIEPLISSSFAFFTN